MIIKTTWTTRRITVTIKLNYDFLVWKKFSNQMKINKLRRSILADNNNNINNKSNKHNKISLTAPISSQCRSRRPGLQIVSDKRTKMQSLNLHLDKKKQTLAVWTHFNASLHYRLILSSLYQIHDTNFTRYPRIRSSHIWRQWMKPDQEQRDELWTFQSWSWQHRLSSWNKKDIFGRQG